MITITSDAVFIHIIRELDNISIQRTDISIVSVAGSNIVIASNQNKEVACLDYNSGITINGVVQTSIGMCRLTLLALALSLPGSQWYTELGGVRPVTAVVNDMLIISSTAGGDNKGDIFQYDGTNWIFLYNNQGTNGTNSSSFIPPGTEVKYSDIIAATNITGTDAYINISPALLPNQYISDVFVSFEENFAASDSSTDVDFNIYDATNSVDLCKSIAGVIAPSRDGALYDSKGKVGNAIQNSFFTYPRDLTQAITLQLHFTGANLTLLTAGRCKIWIEISELT